MRKEIYRGHADDARALLAEVATVHLASTTPDGEPVLRALHAAVVGDALVFHGAPAGEKMSCLGRRAVVSAERIIASIPSWFLDPERACPATTYYESAQVHAPIEEVRDPDEKARALAALMAKYQPEGRHAPLDATSKLYAKAIRGLLVAKVSLAHVDGKVKIGQNRTPAERARILDALWTRGDAGDAEAIATIMKLAPDIPEPALSRRAREAWRAPDGTRFVVALDAADVQQAANMLRGAYWLRDIDDRTCRGAFTRSQATVGVRAKSGDLCAVARATSDGRTAWIYDVVVAPAARGLGIGKALMRLLLDHPAVRAARVVRLGTRDAGALYRGLGFVEIPASGRPPTIEMVRVQSAAAG